MSRGTAHERRLAGIRVVVTRAAVQAKELCRALERAGAAVELFSLLEILPPRDARPLNAAAERDDLDWLLFTSANAVRAYGQARSRPLPEAVQTAVVGKATAAAARQAGFEPSLVARTSGGEGLVEELGARLHPGDRVLLPQAHDALSLVADGLTARGARVEAVVAYDKGVPSDAAVRARELFGEGEIGCVLFASPSAVRNFVEALGTSCWKRRRNGLRAVSIGPTTSEELRRHGVEPAAEALTPSTDALVAATVRAAMA